jgi:hypothetical protein
MIRTLRRSGTLFLKNPRFIGFLRKIYRMDIAGRITAEQAIAFKTIVGAGNWMTGDHQRGTG